jgi:hypothetical protein
LERESDKEREEIAVSGIDDVVMILKSDYENAYFVTGTNEYSLEFKSGTNECSSNTIFSFEIGVFTCAIYAQDCIFEDPTIRFRGKKNLCILCTIGNSC